MKRARRTPGVRTLLVFGATVVVLTPAALYLRANYDVTGAVRSWVVNWTEEHTTLLVAGRAEIEAEIVRARKTGIHPRVEQPAAGPLSVLATNPRYFTAGNGRAVYLTGSHTWSDFQDNGGSDPPRPFDYQQYLDFLQVHGHNFMRLWSWENSRWTVETTDQHYWFEPGPPFRRTGPGKALDGKPRWDLTKLDPGYFRRLRKRVQEAGERGIYVSVMLFNGWSVAPEKGGLEGGDPWRGHPFNAGNNINGINGDLDGNGAGTEVHTLRDSSIVKVQKAYIRRVVDALDDLDNVLYEICNECTTSSTRWQYAMIDYIKEREAGLPKQHPVGMTSEFPGGSNAVLFASDADWISPNNYETPPPATGKKVIIADTDHIWGIGGSRRWVWECLTRGVNPIFMDGYDGAGYGVGGAAFRFDAPRWESLRRNMGYARAYAQRIKLADMEPSTDRCSTRFCLVSTGRNLVRVLAYAPAGGAITIDSLLPHARMRVEWFEPARGRRQPLGEEIVDDTETFEPPFKGDAVLYLQTVSQLGDR